MRALFLEVPEEVIRSRRRLDVDRFDEMWEGELHLSPLPSWEHQGIGGDLEVFFKHHWEQLGEGLCRQHVGVKAPGTPEVELAGERVPADYLGVDEVIVIQRDSKAVKIHRRGAGEYDRVVPEPDGSVVSAVLDTVFRAERGPDGKPVLRLRRGRFPERAGTA